jgi:hypothetical protein
MTLHTQTLRLLDFLLVALLKISTFLQSNVIIVDFGAGLGVLGDLADGLEEVGGFGHGVVEGVLEGFGGILERRCEVYTVVVQFYVP